MAKREKILAELFCWGIDSSYNAFGDHLSQAGVVEFLEDHHIATATVRPHKEISFYSKSAKVGAKAVVFQQETRAFRDAVSEPLSRRAFVPRIAG